MSREELLKLVYKTLRHFFPAMRHWLDAMPDPRDRSRITYPLRSLFWSGVLMFLFHLSARRRLRYDLNSEGGLPNLNSLAQTQLQTLPHPDTLAYFLKNLSPHSLDRLRMHMVRRLLRKRSLERFRLFQRFYLVAIDGTGYLSFRKPHCDQCIQETLSNGMRLYHHPVLEAKLVCANGLAISLGTEFIQNTHGQDKQDCELKAFYRLLPRLRASFPQLTICLLLDGLYLNQNVLSLVSKHRCAWIITFKEGSLPDAYHEFQALHALAADQEMDRTDATLRRQYRRVNDLVHSQHRFHAVECIETNTDGERTRFLWATSLRVTAGNVQTLSEGGRHRWKIENEGFNTQKNGGYRLEHPYSQDWQAAQNFYLLMQVAHLISQLIAKGNLLRVPLTKLFGSISSFAARLLEAWRTATLEPDALQQYLAKPIQIRFDSSSGEGASPAVSPIIPHTSPPSRLITHNPSRPLPSPTNHHL